MALISHDGEDELVKLKFLRFLVGIAQKAIDKDKLLKEYNFKIVVTDLEVTLHSKNKTSVDLTEFSPDLL